MATHNISSGNKTTIFYGTAGDTHDLITSELTMINTINAIASESTEITVPVYNSDANLTIPGPKTSSAFEVTINLEFDNASHIAMENAHDTNTKHSFKVEMTDNAGNVKGYRFDGIVSNWSLDNPKDSVRSATVKISVDGKYEKYTV